MGSICKQCSNKEKDEDEDSNSKNQKNYSPKNSIIANDIRNITEEKLTGEYQEKNELKENEELKPKYSKSSLGISMKIQEEGKDIDKRANNMISEHNKIIFEEDEDEDGLKKGESKTIIGLDLQGKKNQKIALSHFDELKINKKSKSGEPFRRRKKKSSTVKQNPFLFAQLFSNELSIPINQENLIWGKKGLPQSNYVRGKSLGKGAYGNVYESRNPIFNNKVAMKIIDKNKIELDEINDDIKSEINILKKLSHPNIVKIYEFYESDNCFYIINEHCKGGQLYEYLTKNKLTEVQLCVIFYQVFSGLIYLHENNILHGDLKPENILISSVEKNLETNEDFAWIKIIDFGTAKIFKKQIKKGENIEGTLYYIAPEVFSGNIDIYDEKSDIWSIGIILYRALTRKYPFIGRNEDETISFIVDKDHDYNNELLLGYSNEVQDLIKKLLMKDPKERPSAKEALNHEWFSKFNGRRLFTNFKKEEMKPFIDNLLNFSYTKIHQLVIAFLVHNLPETESSQKILKLFRYFNESGNCELSKDELKKGLKEFKDEKEIEEKLDNIFKELDADNNGYIEFEEFLRACIDKKEILNDKYLSYAFKFLDKQNKKLLSPEQIISAFFSEENSALKETMNKILNNNDYDKNGLISFEEFKNIIYSLDNVK